MDKICDRKSFEAFIGRYGGDEKKRMTTQNRQKQKNKTKT